MKNLSIQGHTIAGFASIGALLLGVCFVPTWGSLRQRAVVEASRTFSLASTTPGRYEWSLQDGAPARGQGLIESRSLQFERTDLVDMSLTPGLSTGDEIRAGQVLAQIHSPRNERRLAEVTALRDSLRAERALLQAGGKPAAVTEARKKLDLAIATRDGVSREVARLKTLEADGAVSPVELEVAEIEDGLRSIQIDVARAALDLARAPARPEAISKIDAEIAMQEAMLAEFERLKAEDHIESPINGILEIGGNKVVLRVYDLDTVYLRIPIPESDRNRVAVEQLVRFRTPSASDEVFGGRIVDVGQDASTLNGMQVFWLSVEVPNPEHKLRSGMSGVAYLDLSGRTPGFFTTIYQKLLL